MKKASFLFDFQKFVDELRNDEDKCSIIAKYEKFYGNLDGKSVEDLSFYKDHLSKFEIEDGLLERLNVPDELQNDFDYMLLLRLVAASFSSEFELPYDKDTDTYRLTIKVKSGSASVTKDLDELWSFQIHRLYEIYILEQINLALLLVPDEDAEESDDETGEKYAILHEREMALQRFSRKMRDLQEMRELSVEQNDFPVDFAEFISNI